MRLIVGRLRPTRPCWRRIRRKGQFRRRLHGRHHHGRCHVPQGRDAHQAGVDVFLVILNRPGGDFQHIVPLAHHLVAFEDAGNLADGFLEGFLHRRGRGRTFTSTNSNTGKPSALASSKAVRLAMTPASSSRRIRRQQGDWLNPTRSAISPVDRVASFCSNRRILRSVRSSSTVMSSLEIELLRLKYPSAFDFARIFAYTCRADGINLSPSIDFS